MSALNRTNNSFHMAIEFVSIVEGGEVGRMQEVDHCYYRDPIFAVCRTSLFGVDHVVGRCFSVRGLCHKRL